MSLTLITILKETIHRHREEIFAWQSKCAELADLVEGQKKQFQDLEAACKVHPVPGSPLVPVRLPLCSSSRSSSSTPSTSSDLSDRSDPSDRSNHPDAPPASIQEVPTTPPPQGD